MINAALNNAILKAVLLTSLLLIAVEASGQDFRLSNTSPNVGKGRYQWTVFIDADRSVLSRIDSVLYKLDPAFDNPERKVTAPRTGRYPFSTTDAALQPFQISATVFFKDAPPVRLSPYTVRLRSPAALAESWYVILGSYSLNQWEKANALLGLYRKNGHDARLVNTNDGDFPNFGRSLWLVVLGPRSNRDANAWMSKIRSLTNDRLYVKQAARY
jgi:cell division septation protein DedD